MGESGDSKQLNTSSHYKGVSWNNKSLRWVAGMKIDNKNIHLGYFKSEEDAALAYNKRVITHFGEFAQLNVIA